MIKSKLIDSAKQYPRIEQDSYSGSVYIRTGLHSATKIYQGLSGINSHIKIGVPYSDHTFGDMVPFYGEVTLSSSNLSN